MSSEHLERLGLPHEAVERRLGFLDAYAATCAAQADQLRRRPTPDRVVPRVDDRPRQLEGPLEPGNPADPDPGSLWLLEMDEANTRLEACQWSLLLDEDRAGLRLAGAARLMVNHGHSFGYFLLQALSQGDDDQGNVERGYLDRLASGAGLRSNVDRPDGGDGDVFGSLQAEAYAFLGLCLNPTTAREHRRQLERLGEASTNRHSNLPVGSLSFPLHRIWRCAQASLDPARRLPEIARALALMGRQYTAAIESGSEDSFRWTNCSSSVDAVNLEMLVISAALTRRDLDEPLVRRLDSQGVDPVGMIPIELGIQLARI